MAWLLRDSHTVQHEIVPLSVVLAHPTYDAGYDDDAQGEDAQGDEAPFNEKREMPKLVLNFAAPKAEVRPDDELEGSKKPESIESPSEALESGAEQVFVMHGEDAHAGTRELTRNTGGFGDDGGIGDANSTSKTSGEGQTTGGGNARFASARGGGSGIDEAGVWLAYLREIASVLLKSKFYPPLARQSRQQGVVILEFVIHRDGSVENPQIYKSSGFASLDQAALQALAMAGRLPAFPDALSAERKKLRVPYHYSLGNR